MLAKTVLSGEKLHSMKGRSVSAKLHAKVKHKAQAYLENK